jgi:hypothetical protein
MWSGDNARRQFVHSECVRAFTKQTVTTEEKIERRDYQEPFSESCLNTECLQEKSDNGEE